MKRKFLLLLSVVTLTFTVSCNKEDAESTHSSGQNGSFEEAGNQAEQDIMDLTNAEGIQAIRDLMGTGSDSVITNGRLADKEESKSYIKKKVKRKVNEIKRLFVPDNGKIKRTQANDDVYFDYEGATGVYEYDENSGTVEKTGSSQNIVIHYPYDGASRNNATFTIYGYSETDSVPTNLNADITVDGNTVVTISYSATLNSNYDPDQETVLPLRLSSVNYSFYVKPFTMSFGFQGSSNSLSYNTSLTRLGENIFSSGVTVNFDDNVDPVDADFVNGKIYPPESLDAYVQYSYLRLNIGFNIDEMRDDQQNNQDLNFVDYLSGDVTNEDTGNQIGEVTSWNFDNNNGNTEIIVTKSNGSEENLYEIFEPAVQEAENIAN